MRLPELGLRLFFFVSLIALNTASAAQPSDELRDFSVTLERTGCLGSCPDYKVTISGTGAVLYEGRSSVHAKGERRSKISASAVQQIIQTLRSEQFFQWDEDSGRCVDAPEIHITVRLNGLEKQVKQGCSPSDKVLHLAREIETTSGAKKWVGRRSLH